MAKIDYRIATRMLSKGASVREVAEHFGVTTQAIYWAISEGHVKRKTPAPAAR